MDFVLQKEIQEVVSGLKSSTKRKIDRGKKHYVAHETREGWNGELPFYLFLCKKCGHYAKDYPHGFIHRQYLLCSHCKWYHDFVPWWVPFAQMYYLLKFVLFSRFAGKRQ